MEGNYDSADKKTRFKAELVARLQNPAQLRAFLVALLLLIGYVGVYMPLSSGMETTSRKLAQEKRRLDLARDIEHLRAQSESFQNRLPEQRDPNEWVEYVLSGVRSFPVKLAKLDADAARDLGPYKAVVLRMEFEGSFSGLDSFLGWLESNERLFRVDSVKIAPHKGGNGKLTMQLVVLGVMG